MDVLTPIKKNVIDPTLAVSKGVKTGLVDTITTKKGASDVAYMVVGGLVAGIVTIGILPRIPFGKLPFGREIASAFTLGVGVSMSAYGKKTGSGASSSSSSTPPVKTLDKPRKKSNQQLE